jgi:putative membrane protein
MTTRRKRLTLWNSGWLVLCAAWLTPLVDLAGQAFYIHMTLHMMVVAIAAPLLSFAIAGARWDPVRVIPSIFAAVPASIGELMLVWTWHLPMPHHWAQHTTSGLVVEQASFLLVGLWLWLSAIGGEQPRSRERSAAGTVGLLLTSIHMTLLGALLALAPRPLFEHHHGFGALTPLQDQHLGGAVMLVVGGIAYLVGGLWLTKDLVSPVRIEHGSMLGASE